MMLKETLQQYPDQIATTQLKLLDLNLAIAQMESSTAA